MQQYEYDHKKCEPYASKIKSWNPSEKHSYSLKHILKYLRQMKVYMLIYSIDGLQPIVMQYALKPM